MSEFSQKVLKVVHNIPQGEVRSYQQVAAAVGSPKAYRAVANLMKGNWNTEVPCHRVIHTDGRVGKYNREGGEVKKIERLKLEGVKVNNGYVEN